MITIDLPPNAQKILGKMAKAAGTNEHDIVLDAIVERIEYWHDPANCHRSISLCANLMRSVQPDQPLNDVGCRVHAGGPQGSEATGS